MARAIQIEDYHPTWAQDYPRESNKLAVVFADQMISIHHIGSTAIQTQLNFRDYLRFHPADAQAYSQRKEKLARESRENLPAYTEAKTDFVLEINQQAARWREANSPKSR